MFIEDLLIVI